MDIVEYNKIYKEEIKDLLVKLQEFIVEIDIFKLNIVNKNYREKYFKNMINTCNKNSGKIFVAKENNNILGFIAGYLQKYTKDDKLDYLCPKKGIICELIVDKNNRKNGTGTNLLKKMEQYFKSQKCEYVQLDVFAYNFTARDFYQKNNYKERMITMFKKL